MYNNVLQMMVHAGGTYGPLATETSGKDTLTCRWKYGRPFHWELNGHEVSQTEAASWLQITHEARRARWAIDITPLGIMMP